MASRSDRLKAQSSKLKAQSKKNALWKNVNKIRPAFRKSGLYTLVFDFMADIIMKRNAFN